MSIQPIPTSFLPYHEPGIETILILSSLLLVLNVINTAFDQLIFCGLLGQVFVGVAWGTPGAKWLSVETEHVIVQLGYLGLILLVYEGGLTTSFRSLKANLALSAAVAITGICFPIAFSFVLVSLSNATPIQAFAAGAALCSTSLGTTFTILSTSGLSTTRLGVVLSSAAMMDDVVGLIMVQVISNLGASSDAFSAETVVRPLATAILLGLVTGATYAGTSNLFAAYLAGAASSWWDSEVPHINGAVKTSTSTQDIAVIREPRTSAVNGPVVRSTGSLQDTRQVAPEHYNPVVSTGAGVFETHYETALRCILKPFFFASIGFAIPITDMFRGDIVWRGIVYTILMLLAKLVTGIWLVRLDISWPKVHLSKALRSILNFPASCIGLRHSKQKSKGDSSSAPTIAGQDSNHEPLSKSTDDAPASAPAPATASLKLSPPMNPRPSDASPPLATSTQASKISRPLSLYPAAILGTAMTARGEIGFLIASLAETTGIFSPSGESISESSEIYLVVTWAIVLCTIIGPLSIGTLVKRVRRLDRDRTEGSGNGKGDPLGIWGVG
ncbi:related to Na+/H+ antiporter [Rhynchosporium graminicola]|uniref:Related to Na+/H+ antiporter n=1 Tax=Rhynchosporium graminicola TaxID=2792576 RepID=A0A1E1K655_9HELO|nr:related to Na+/H+ antiporter [Rhynchosporium commune]